MLREKDDLVELMGSLDLTPRKAEKPPYSSELLYFASFKTVPDSEYVKKDLTTEKIKELLSKNLVITKAVNGLPVLCPKTDLPTSMEVKTDATVVDAEVKPNLLILVLSIFQDRYGSRPNNFEKMTTAEKEEWLVKGLYEFDIIGPRNPLKNVAMADKNSYWEFFACRPLVDGPLFIDRTKSYDTVPGSIGHMFENLMTRNKGFHRVYVVRKGKLGKSNVRIALTGEIDAIQTKKTANGGEETELVELTSRPQFKPPRVDRQVSNYVQSILGGVQVIVTGGFTGNRYIGNKFEKRNIHYEPIATYARKIPLEFRKNPFEFVENVLKIAMDKCSEVGVVYLVKGSDDEDLITVTPVTDQKATFAMTEKVIKRCAAAIYKE